MSIRRMLRNVAIVPVTMSLVALPAMAAPLPPLAPIDVCGTIQLVKWLPRRSLPPVAGMSGSAGRERGWTARFVVVLDNICGVSEPVRARINGLLTTSYDGAGMRPHSGQILLVLGDDSSEQMVQGKGLCVTGFYVSGDEGGTWTHHGVVRFSAGGCLSHGE